MKNDLEELNGDITSGPDGNPITSADGLGVSRQSHDVRRTLPGAYAVRGPCYNPERENQMSTERTSDELPVARALAMGELSQQHSDNPFGAFNARRTKLVLEAMLIGCSSATIFICIWIFSKSEASFISASVFPSLMPSPIISNSPSTSMLPTSSLQPTTERLHAIKELLIPISGEDVLNDPKSIQNFAWNSLGTIDWHTIPLTEPEKIIQRYSIMVVGFSVLNWYDFEARILQDSVLMECDIFFCNENGEVVDMVIFNNLDIGANGIIPKEIGQLKNLKRIVFRNNRSIGTIPTEIGLLKNLTHLDVGQNSLTGPIPSEIGNLENLEWLILSQNKLQNSIPREVGKLKNLIFGAFANNSISGNIPTTVNAMNNLKGLQLQHNQLSGDAEFICDRNYDGVAYYLDVDTRNKLYYGRNEYNLSLVFDVTIDCDDVLQCSCCPCI